MGETLLDPEIVIDVWLTKDGQRCYWQIMPSLDRTGWQYRKGTMRSVVAGGARTTDEALRLRHVFDGEIVAALAKGWVASEHLPA